MTLAWFCDALADPIFNCSGHSALYAMLLYGYDKLAIITKLSQEFF